MNYGYFDDKNREYVITRPDTPAPWVNYLGSPEYGAIISNNAGGYSFEKSGANGRILRYVFNGFDQPGRYIYLKDNRSGDYWSASWQPVGKDLELYKSECRHGTGYTVMHAEYAGISSDVSYYVPLNETYEVWAVDIANQSEKEREVTITGYAEFTNNSNYEMDQVNLQYSQFISRTVDCGNFVQQRIHGNLEMLEKDEKVDNKIVTYRFFGLAGAPVSGCCGDREAFLGRYHGYGDPVCVSGKMNGVMAYNENSCGAVASVVKLAPGAHAHLVFLLGAKDTETTQVILDRYSDPAGVVPDEIESLKMWWWEKLDHFRVRTPNKEFDHMMNTWNGYNCFMTFIWSRAASFIYCGMRNGYGYRDTVQDIQGVIHLAPGMAREKICFMLSAQVDNGGGLPLVKFDHNAGHETTPDDPEYVKETGHPAYRADDALWLFPTVYKYISETGEISFLEEEIPFANRDSGTVYEHLRRAVEFSLNRLGPHGMPAGLYADWNDCLRLGKDGESSFVAMQLYLAMKILIDFAQRRKDNETVRWLRENMTVMGDRIRDLCWDSDRYIRGFTEDGEVIGGKDDPEADLWLNPQSWAVISSLAGEEQADQALDQVYHRLNTAYGAILMDPPYHAHAFPGALARIYNQGTKENSGIFSQSQGWIILAEALRGHGDRAMQYYMENCPAAQNDRAEIRHLEPYCYGQFTEGKDSPHFGRSHVHWLTGTASTMMVGCVEGILGIRPDPDGLRISPAVPKEWDHFEIEKVFRGKKLHIIAENPNGKESGCVKLILNGENLPENYIPADLLKEENEIMLFMS